MLPKWNQIVSRRNICLRRILDNLAMSKSLGHGSVSNLQRFLPDANSRQVIEPKLFMQTDNIARKITVPADVSPLLWNVHAMHSGYSTWQ